MAACKIFRTIDTKVVNRIISLINDLFEHQISIPLPIHR